MPIDSGHASSDWCFRHPNTLWRNLDKADAILVDDYCYMITWVAKEQAEQSYKDGFAPWDELDQGYDRLIASPRHVFLCSLYRRK